MCGIGRSVVRSPSKHRLVDLDAVLSVKCVTADSDSNCVKMLGSLITSSFATHGSGLTLPLLCINRLPHWCQWSAHVCKYGILPDNSLQVATIAIPSRSGSQTEIKKIIQRQYYLQVACNNVWNHFPISPPSMHALVPGQWLLAYD